MHKIYAIMYRHYAKRIELSPSYIHICIGRSIYHFVVKHTSHSRKWYRKWVGVFLHMDKQQILCSYVPVHVLSKPTVIPYLSNGSNIISIDHDDVIKWEHFPRYWPFVRGIHRSPVNSPHKGQWLGALMFSLICAWINVSVNNREAGELRRYRASYDVTVMFKMRAVTDPL